MLVPLVVGVLHECTLSGSIGCSTILDVNLLFNPPVVVSVSNGDVIPFIYINLYIHAFRSIPDSVHVMIGYLWRCIIITPHKVRIIVCIDIDLGLEVSIGSEADIECIKCSPRIGTHSTEQLPIE